MGGRDLSPYDLKDLHECCNVLGLLDMKSVGCFHTWSNNSLDKPIYSKLDRVMVNKNWLTADFDGFASFLPSGCLSDHSPCVTRTVSQQQRGVKPFKFFNMWIGNPKFQQIVESTWNRHYYGREQFILCKKLKLLKGPLKTLNAKEYSHISSRVERACAELEDVQMKLQNDIDNHDLQSQIAVLTKKARFLSEAERDFLVQKSKCNYLLNTDRCNKFFHGLIKRNIKINSIAQLKLEDGSWTESTDQVVSAFQSFYSSLLGTKDQCEAPSPDVIVCGPVLNSELCEGLICAVSDEEILTALKSIGNDKSPGPDGYNSNFDKSTWSIIDPSVCAAVKEFFINGRLLRQINHTILALIPKTTHASEVGDFRPIACCNVLYKLISKVLASRLAGVLDSLVDKSQSAFVSGRLISDNIQLVAALVMHYQRKRTAPKCMLKVDLRKAYDSIDWEFLRTMMKELKFPDFFVCWIMECVTTTSYSLSLNGFLHAFDRTEMRIRLLLKSVCWRS